MSSNLAAAAEAVAEAVRQHAAAVQDSAPARPERAAALVAALDDYGAAVLNAGLELPEDFDDFNRWLGEEDGVPHPDLEPEPEQRIAVFLRADFTVEDIDALRAAGLERLVECCPVHAFPEEHVHHPADALQNLLGHAPVFQAEEMARYGVGLLSEHIMVLGGVEESDFPEGNPWEPLLHLDDAGE